MNSKMLPFLFVAFCSFIAAAQEMRMDSYKYLSYDEMRQKLFDLQAQYPTLMRIESSEEKYAIPHTVACGDQM